MDERFNSVTNPSLLARLRDVPNDSRTWDEFVVRYGPKIRQWCLAWGLQHNDADDVVQNVLLDLSKQMRSFEYDPNGRFRAWLKTIARRAWYDYSARLRKQQTALSDSILDSLVGGDAQEDLMKRLDEECRRDMLEIAKARVKSRVNEQTWLAFELSELKQLSVQETATKLDVKPGYVYVARSRVQKLLIEEVQLLDEP